LWEEAFRSAGVEADDYLRAIVPGTALPWDTISTGMKPEFLRSEREKAVQAQPTPSCDDRDCADCRGCETGMRRRRNDAEHVEAGAGDPPALLGRPAEAPVRYIVRYAKQGPARYLGHNDLVNGLQRVFRRAGVETAFSEGFHPKPVMSFGPALPLGMAGRDEFLEFKSGRDIGEAEFLAAVHAAAPSGIRFLALGRRGSAERPLQERLRGMVYSGDLRDPVFAEAPIAGPEAAAKVAAAAAADPGFAWLETVEASPDGASLFLRIAFRAQKIPRPQDLIGKALNLERPSFVLTREAFLTTEPAASSSLPI
jgi:hypothetical protein